MKDLIVTHRGTVYPWQCDHMGHMNVMWYVGKFDEATWNLFAEAGFTTAYLRENSRGMVAVQQSITYKQELFAGDVIVIRSGILEVREKAVRFMHEMIKLDTGEVAATTELTGVHIDTVKRKSVAMPAEARVRLEEFTVSPAAYAHSG
jgi:acyl-CoA thioester hydrolase